MLFQPSIKTTGLNLGKKRNNLSEYWINVHTK